MMLKDYENKAIDQHDIECPRVMVTLPTGVKGSQKERAKMLRRKLRFWLEGTLGPGILREMEDGFEWIQTEELRETEEGFEWTQIDAPTHTK